MSGIGTKQPWQGLVCAASGSMLADTVCCPLDVVKVRMQLSQSGVLGEYYTGIGDAARKIWAKERIQGFYKGLTPCLLRSGTYGTCRIAIYEPLKSLVAGKDTPRDMVTPGQKVLAALLSGTLSSFVFTPADVIKIRMQGDRDGKLYRGVVHAAATIFRTEKLVGLYKGSAVNVCRAGVCAVVELATYDEVKKALCSTPAWGFGDSLPTHLVTALIAGFCSTVASQPVDLLKSRLMHSADRVNVLSFCLQTMRREGFRGMYAGFWPNYLRIGPHT
eukprot:gene462-678_t